MRKLIGTFLRDEDGSVAVEYGLIVSLVGVAMIAALQDLGQAIANMYIDIGRAIDRVAISIR